MDEYISKWINNCEDFELIGLQLSLLSPPSILYFILSLFVKSSLLSYPPLHSSLFFSLLLFLSLTPPPPLSFSHSSSLFFSLLLSLSLTPPLPFSHSSILLLFSHIILTATSRLPYLLFSSFLFSSLVLVLIFLSPVESEALCRHNVVVEGVDCKRQQQDMTEPPGCPETRTTENL